MFSSNYPKPSPAPIYKSGPAPAPVDKMLRYTSFAHAAQALSKDPSTKVGAVVLDDDCNVLIVGYNGFPRGVTDSPKRYADRDTKYAMIVHAEANAVAQAARTGVRLMGATMVVTGLYPCSDCAGLIIQAGIKRVIAPKVCASHRWATSWVTAKTMLDEAGVEIILYEVEDE